METKYISLLNLPIEQLIHECNNPRDDIIKIICKNDIFWRDKISRDFPSNSQSPTTTWKDLYNDLVIQKKISFTVSNIMNKLRNDVYYKRKKIVNKYNQELWEGYREPRECVGKYEKLTGTSVDTFLYTETEKRTWLLLTGSEGKTERDRLMKQKLRLAFSNYYNATAKTKKFYGVIFLCLTLIGEYYYYGHPDTINETSQVIFKYTYYTMPSEIVQYFNELLSKQVRMVKLYMFISPAEINPENFRWIINYSELGEEKDAGEEVGWDVTLEWTQHFITALLNDGDLDNTPFPVITETTDSGCHKSLCGPWL